MAVQDSQDRTASRQERVKEIIRKRHKAPVFLYNIDERISSLVNLPAFPDAILAVLAFIGACSALKFYPLMISIPIAIVIFAVTVKKPFLGFLTLVTAIMPLLMYQFPALTWLYLMVLAGALLYGYKYHRTLLFLYVLIAFTFSPLGLALSIPTFIVAVLMVGYKRAMILAVLFVVAAVALSAVTGVQNNAYVTYNAAYAHNKVVSPALSPYVTPSHSGLTLMNFSSGLSQTIKIFTSSAVINLTSETTNAVAAAFTINTASYLIDLGVLVIVALGIDSMATASRSRFRGTTAGFVGLGYVALAIALPSVMNQPVNFFMPIVSFGVAIAFLVVTDALSIKVVNVLDIRKQDLRMKFGEAFEDLEAGSANETFDDIANYAATKRELVDAVLGPIEEKAISKAYNVRPAKGILFFGPPGTGKTLMMRALANEIHAGFFAVKAPNLISAYPGETERMISNIFSIAKKNAPCILFFDEIDSIAPSRERLAVGDSNRQALSQLLVEMDGFVKTSNVIMVGATNSPNLLDNAVIRPGRFDKIIYLPPPDFNARKQIFSMYLKKLPISKEMDLDKIAEVTERYTGADIKVLCESVAQKVAQEASTKHSVLEITQEDIMGRIKATKPSVTMAQIEQYKKFRLDFERSVYGQKGEESKGAEIGMRNVIGLEEAKKAINEAVEMPLLHPELLKKYNIKAINGMLIFGPPGNGKTMLLRAIKDEMKGITMLDMNGAELAEQGIEKAVQTIKETFDRASSNAPSIILIDEIEELLAKRGSGSEYSAQITSEMLRELDGVGKIENVIVIGTSNRPDAIDPAALRPGRLDKLVFVKPPNKKERAEMFKENLEGVPVSDKVDYDQLGEKTEGFTGADIYHLCREAKTSALNRAVKGGEEETHVEMDDIVNLIPKVKASAPPAVVEEYTEFFTKFGER